MIGASGQLGGAATLVALASGVAQVVAVGRNVAALDRLVAHDRRVDRCRRPRSPGNRRGCHHHRSRGDVDVVIDALGAAPTTDLTMAGFDALCPDGTMVLLGGIREVLPIPYSELMRRRITLRGSWMASLTVRDVWRMVAGRTIDLNVLGVHTIGLDDPGAALQLAAHRRGLDIAVLVP